MATTMRVAAVLVLSIALGMARAEPLSVNVFPGGFNWPLWVAQEEGFFAREGLEVTVTPTPNSMAQMQGLASGRHDIAFSTIDNVIAYTEGQGEVTLPEPADFVAVFGAQFGAVRLVARPGITRIEDLRGRKVGVDAATTGYAFVLYRLLEDAGLRRGDYEVVKVGGTAARAEALMAGAIDATILTSPLEIEPEARGCVRLADAVPRLGPYQAVSGVTRRAWAREHETTLVRFIRAYVAALEWLRVESNLDGAVALYRRHLPTASEAAARKAWSILVKSGEGFQREARLDMQGIATVLALRSRYGEPAKSLSDAKRYVDERYHLQAVKDPRRLTLGTSAAALP